MISENRRSSWPRDVVDKCRNRLQANVSIHAPHETARRWIYQARRAAEVSIHVPIRVKRKPRTSRYRGHQVQSCRGRRHLCDRQRRSRLGDQGDSYFPRQVSSARTPEPNPTRSVRASAALWLVQLIRWRAGDGRSRTESVVLLGKCG